ncbi:S-layer homology domain-containing protein [Anaerobacillus isosaccharinicus]|uniref:S-layer homology domain-containing protein n=1 Tax=Anaerobacillus isosaccharinicus TaxID=1532552 RepID=A0A1S2L926_9BACI|nr:S-layer homology domain-containing protein [Anaerobacillus isosaccharinicus]MBA5584618.1 S-layer homology domain-containing protein [Anaerobacillus isosaccharinicus]QOY37005.1 S-layer homology domain-containing protein [Anaerobacillus isosaccharinicus]
MGLTTYMKLAMVTLLLPLLTWTNPTATSAQAKFTDYKPGDFGYANVITLAEQDIIKGYPDGSFRPNHRLNRADSAVLFQRALKLKAPTHTTSFKDVPQGLYYTSAAAATKEAGIFKGSSNGTFGPMDLLTREQMASVLVRAFQLKPVSTNTVVINDQKSISASHLIDVITLYQNDVTKGKSGNVFDPKGVVTRAEFSVFLFRAMELKKDGVDIGDPIQPGPGAPGGTPVTGVPSVSSAHLTTSTGKQITGVVNDTETATTISFDLSAEPNKATLRDGKITVTESGTMTLSNPLGGTETETLSGVGSDPAKRQKREKVHTMWTFSRFCLQVFGCVHAR